MRRLRRLLREPALRGLIFGLWLVLFSWPFWSDPSFRAISFLFPYHLVCWLLLAAVLGLMAHALGRGPGPEEEPGGEDELDI